MDNSVANKCDDSSLFPTRDSKIIFAVIVILIILIIAGINISDAKIRTTCVVLGVFFGIILVVKAMPSTGMNDEYE